MKFKFLMIDVDGNVTGTNDEPTAQHIAEASDETVVIDVTTGAVWFNGDEHVATEAETDSDEEGG